MKYEEKKRLMFFGLPWTFTEGLLRRTENDCYMYLVHIKNAKEIKDKILLAAEDARIARRTINTMNIDAN